jgi:hypothetical protein
VKTVLYQIYAHRCLIGLIIICFTLLSGVVAVVSPEGEFDSGGRWARLRCSKYLFIDEPHQR